VGSGPIAFTFAFDCADEHPVRCNLNILHQAPLAHCAVHTLLVFSCQSFCPQTPPRRPLQQPKRRLDDPQYAVFRVRHLCLKRDCRAPQSLGQGLHIIGNLVAHCVWYSWIGGERLVVCELGVEVDQQVMVVEVLDCFFRACAQRQGRDMVKRCGRVECCSQLGGV
jgi:hypothetical protein